MLNKIIHFSLRTNIGAGGIRIATDWRYIYFAMHTEVDVFPDLNTPTVVIMTEANGMAAEEVEQLVTFPVETAVNSATGSTPRTLFLYKRVFRRTPDWWKTGNRAFICAEIVSRKPAVVSDLYLYHEYPRRRRLGPDVYLRRSL